MRFGILGCQRPSTQTDVELGQSHQDFMNGFPSASAFVASDPDHCFSIYNAFHRLSSRNLLYMEAEIFELQKQQDDLDIRDSRGDPDTIQCFRSWKRLKTSTDPRQLEQMELIMKIKQKLKEYQEALVLQEAVLKMGKPHSGTVEAFKLWLDGKSKGPGGRHAPSFSGLSAARLNNEEDLDSHVDESLALFSMRKTKKTVGILSMLLAAIMFTVSIVSLYLVTNNTTRLGLICAFTVLLAAILQLLTNASRTELFACTAAYAAVLVVFVSGNLGSTCCNNVHTAG
ncbi:hypothetical protein N431DRAFT_519815 [Stipitochalara longipes BDJ]|nr:hypothetical protein N431DRAFT_519815 [Stipitochalara longipes BDJ]